MLFVIMHDVGIQYNVVLVFGFVNEIINVPMLDFSVVLFNYAVVL